MHFLLIYKLSDNYLDERVKYRAEHLKLAWEAHENNELILGGALSDPADQAILFFQGESAEVAEKFACSDPYVRNNLVAEWSVRKWTTVVGAEASTPVRG